VGADPAQKLASPTTYNVTPNRKEKVHVHGRSLRQAEIGAVPYLQQRLRVEGTLTSDRHGNGSLAGFPVGMTAHCMP